ncbi:MAG: membrane protein insertion efficiency factor YidD [Candidatus Buchananbacteria bacterium RIFCSPHIGHO2_01_FULL_44_11]|uniref:Putative membrane protein insertion efficiency factor n=1 Tax=Candidatus Buchananbacteria bacterium RIFCSPHIGHO2_01_FULL_44_11 TaxID=1797535 RepID=A0A1G1Y114_9BACT|nr:MAG: membrane protein insertion efficiency factor YidD [Candidatus Buchananbacteria bacterium RIFCSPHIGHO2_01_FULL_44_11]
MAKLFFLPRLLVLRLIRLYQKTLSFDHGFLRRFFPNGYCRFHPTCSEYGYQAVAKYGIWRGGFKALGRVLRCNPFNAGGHDPLV